MTVVLFRSIAMFALLLAFATPVPAFAASRAMEQASQTLVAKGLAVTDVERARQLFEQAIVADPANVAAFTALGRLYQRQGKQAQARKYYDLALSVDPTEPDALYSAAELDIAENKTDEARDRLRKLDVICPACRQTHDLQLRLGQPGSAPGASLPLVTRP